MSPMHSTLLIIASVTCLATYLGGLFAIRFRDKLHLILGFSAGAVIGVALFDLLPEAIRLSKDEGVMLWVAAGFILYLVIDRFLQTDDSEKHITADTRRGLIGAGGFSIHSLLDGIGIGLAFQISSAIGLVVALGVIAHDFSDGINTVSVILKNGGTRDQALRWLLTDALAPVAGILLTLTFGLPEPILAKALALFAGFFLYIGASDLIPESYHNHPTAWTTVATILGVLIIYGAVHFAG